MRAWWSLSRTMSSKSVAAQRLPRRHCTQATHSDRQPPPCPAVHTIQFMAAIQAVYVRGHEERTEPKAHIVYRIEVQASVRSWQMWRRYSEFVDLHTELTKSTGSPPPCELPPKYPLALSSISLPLRRPHRDPKILSERVSGLEAYLRAIVSSKEDTWREAYAFKEFLGIPVGRQTGGEGTSASDFTSTSWLDEHMELQSRIRDIRADLNKRDAFHDKGDVSSAHSTNVQAKKKLAAIFTRVGTLASGLQTLALKGLSEGEVQRRSDMVARLQDDCEKLSKMMVAARLPSRAVGSAVIGGQRPASENQQAALFSTGAGQPNRPIARIFGSAAKPEETEQTRPLDDHGLFVLQQEQMHQQDSQLSELSSILLRQKQLGIAIGQEISEHIDMLDDLSENVDRVGGKLSSAKRQLNRLG